MHNWLHYFLFFFFFPSHPLRSTQAPCQFLLFLLSLPCSLVLMSYVALLFENTEPPFEGFGNPEEMEGIDEYDASNPLRDCALDEYDASTPVSMAFNRLENFEPESDQEESKDDASTPVSMDEERLDLPPGLFSHDDDASIPSATRGSSWYVGDPSSASGSIMPPPAQVTSDTLERYEKKKY